jgi:cell wall-associated NlpC family hydrolase
MTAAVCALTAALILPDTAAHAQPKPDAKAAQQKLRALNKQVDALVQQYDKSAEQLQQARRKLAAMNQAVRTEQATYDTLHQAVVQMAAAAYKSGGGNDPTLTGVLAANDPSAVLDQMSVITAVSRNRGSQLAQFVASAQRLQLAQGQDKAAIEQIAQAQASLKSQKAALEKQIAAQKKLITAAGGQVDTGTPASAGGCGKVQASAKALIAIRFACSKLGTPYLYGGTGPRYDCSGLTQASWRAAGVSLPRTTSEQWTAGTHVTYSQLQPGDLIFFESNLGHMGIYIGGGKLVHSPQTGEVVKVSDLTTGWFRQEFQGGVRVS